MKISFLFFDQNLSYFGAYFFPFDFIINLGQALPTPWARSSTCPVSRSREWRWMPGTPDLGRLRQEVYYKLKASLVTKSSYFQNRRVVARFPVPSVVFVCLFHCDWREDEPGGRATHKSQWKADDVPLVPCCAMWTLLPVGLDVESRCALWSGRRGCPPALGLLTGFGTHPWHVTAVVAAPWPSRSWHSYLVISFLVPTPRVPPVAHHSLFDDVTLHRAGYLFW